MADSTQDALFNKNVTLGNATSDVTTATGQLTAHRATIPDDKMLRFGSATGGDAHIKYDEATEDNLIISGNADIRSPSLVVQGHSEVLTLMNEDGVTRGTFIGSAMNTSLSAAPLTLKWDQIWRCEMIEK